MRLLLVLLALAFACGDDSAVVDASAVDASTRDAAGPDALATDTGPRTGHPISVRVAECGFGAAGAINPFLYGFDECLEECLATGSCDELEGLFCRGSTLLDERCAETCALDCGDGSTYSSADICDGDTDCTDNRDEADCIVCDGETILAIFVCDGVEDCSDGADEAGCEVFTCDDGSTVTRYARCDDEVDCPDSSDEMGCATLTCP